MDEPRLISSDDRVVALDYGTFHLISGDFDPDDYVRVLDVAVDGIGQLPGIVVVTSPHQNNFEMPLRVEVWDGEPGTDLDEWQEAFEVHLDVGDAGLFYESPTCDDEPLLVPPGSYHALVAGRGFVAIGWPGSTAPGDSWRIRLWPSSGPDAPRRLRAYEAPRIHHPDPRVPPAAQSSRRGRRQ